MHFDGQTSAAALPVTTQEEQAILIASYIESDDDFGDIAVCADCNLITINPKKVSNSSGVPAVTSSIL